MKNYRIDFTNVTRKGEEINVIMEFQREHFTNCEFRDFLITQLFSLACEGAEYAHQNAYIKRDGETVLVARCETEVDGSDITAYVSIARPREKFYPLRSMAIAR